MEIMYRETAPNAGHQPYFLCTLTKGGTRNEFSRGATLYDKFAHTYKLAHSNTHRYKDAKRLCQGVAVEETQHTSPEKG